MRRIVFVGNCQLLSLSQLYQRFAEQAGREEIAYTPSYQDLTEDRIATIARADVVIEQRMDVAPRADLNGIVTRAERHFVPLLGGGFLWPFAGQPHPRNEIMGFLAGGPFDGEMGDSYLNRLIEKEVPPAEAVEQYLALDVNRVRNLDRFFEIVVDRQRSRDAACGFQIAGIMEEKFRDEPLFRTAHHPNLRIALAFAEQFFQKMGVDAASIRRMRERVRVTPYPKTQSPIHPAVARHFGLKYADASTRYRIRDEGRFTFAEYALQYMRAEWNRDLAEGMALASSDLHAALAKLEVGLRSSPGSFEGWFIFSDVLRRAGRAAEAETAGRRAIALEPLEGRYFSGLAHTLAALGRLDEAADAASRAIALDPVDPHFYGLAANTAARRNRLSEAEALARRAVELAPDNPHLHNMLADLLIRQDRPEDALTVIQSALTLAPENAAFHLVLSRTLDRAGRREEALEAAWRAAALDPDHGPIQGHLSGLLIANGEPDNALRYLRGLLAAKPEEAGLHEQLGHVLARLGRAAEAEGAFKKAIELAPDAAGPLSGLSHTLARLGRHVEAISAIEAAIEMQPGFAPYHLHRGNQLRITEDLDRAEAAYTAALKLDPTNVEAARQLQGVRAAKRAEVPVA